MTDSITEDEIRDKLAKHYGGDNSTRDLIKNVREDGNGGVGSIVYSLDGTPPKGYAIYIPELSVVNLYDNRGERFRNMTSTRIEDADN